MCVYRCVVFLSIGFHLLIANYFFERFASSFFWVATCDTILLDFVIIFLLILFFSCYFTLFSVCFCLNITRNK